MTKPPFNQESPADTAAKREQVVQSVHTKRIFDNEDLMKLQERTEIDSMPQIWDVGVPMVGDRPALDDMLVKSGRTHKERVALTLALEDDGNVFTASITNRHVSRTDTAVLPFGVPMVTEMPDTSIFSELASSIESFGFMKLSIGKDGSVKLLGAPDESQEPSTILDVSGQPGSPDHIVALNFAERMLAIPFFDGVFRAPLSGVVQQ